MKRKRTDNSWEYQQPERKYGIQLNIGQRAGRHRRKQGEIGENGKIQYRGRHHSCQLGKCESYRLRKADRPKQPFNDDINNAGSVSSINDDYMPSRHKNTLNCAISSQQLKKGLSENSSCVGVGVGGGGTRNAPQSLFNRLLKGHLHRYFL